MPRGTRIAVAAILAVAVAALPLLLDRCAESCDAHQSALTAAPACHHATSTGTHVTRLPASCGHDHDATALTTAKTLAPTAAAFDLAAAVDHSLSVAPPPGADARLDPLRPPDTARALAARSLPLRV